MSAVAIVDVGTGNLHSVLKAVEHVAPRAQPVVSADPAVIRRAGHVIFPGQGAIGSCVAAIAERGLREVLLESIADRPFLGICLGLQLMLDHSDEDGGVSGFGVVPGQVRGFAEQFARAPARDPVLKIPHMGWNQVRQDRPHRLWRGIPDQARFYFVHSYYAQAGDPAQVAGSTDYGVRFAAAVARDNVFAVQFHPEKSQHAGLALLGNFVEWDGGA